MTFAPDTYSGSVPASPEGFATLEQFGVKTVISVDGAVPDVEAAEAHGLRYIHLPIGYNGFSERRRLELVRATRDALAIGPVYIHCHHGKHRSAAAAASVAIALGMSDEQTMVERMKVAGTSPHYRGLYAAVAETERIGKEIVDGVPSDFPSVSEPTTTIQAMVDIEIAVDHLTRIDEAGWKTPPDHPDLVPGAEAGRLADLFRVLMEAERSHGRRGSYERLMADARRYAQSLEDQIVADTPAEGLRRQFRLVTDSCVTCHAAHRDHSRRVE